MNGSFLIAEDGLQEKVMSGNLLEFEPGDVLFKQGDPGGKFYIIKSGSVEIYQEQKDDHLILTYLGVGDVLGLLTFVDNSPRLASARAYTKVVCQEVEKSKALANSNTPSWVMVVIKEYASRLSQMNKGFIEQKQKLELLERNSLNHLFKTQQICNTMIVLGSYLARTLDDQRKVVTLSDLILPMTNMLSYEDTYIQKIIEVLKGTGLLKVEKDPDKNVDIIAISHLEKLKWFTQYIIKSQFGLEKRQVNSKMPHKYRKILIALADYANRKKDSAASGTITIDVTDLENELEKVTGQAFAIEAIYEAQKLELLMYKEEKKHIEFNPSSLVRVLISIQTIQRLKSDDLSFGETSEA